MLYWNEIINDLHGFVVHIFKFIWRSYKCSMCEPFVRYQYDSLILSKQTRAYPHQHLQQLLWCQGRWRGADITKECLETNFHLSSMLLHKLCVHYANGFDNVESVYFFYSNTVYWWLTEIDNRVQCMITVFYLLMNNCVTVMLPDMSYLEMLRQ
jgi:hypothetical protein